MKRALLALMLSACIRAGDERLDGTWLDGKDVANYCNAYTFGPGELWQVDHVCAGTANLGTYDIDGDMIHVSDNSGEYDVGWELGTGLVVRHGDARLETTLRLDFGNRQTALGREIP